MNIGRSMNPIDDPGISDSGCFAITFRLIQKSQREFVILFLFWSGQYPEVSQSIPIMRRIIDFPVPFGPEKRTNRVISSVHESVEIRK